MHIARNGVSAFDEAVAFHPDVTLLDIGLPLMNGYEVAKKLRQHPNLKELVLVATTGYGQESDRLHSKEAGFDHHLVKPIDFGRVKEILEAVSKKITRL